jgi:hypothetical protein
MNEHLIYKQIITLSDVIKMHHTSNFVFIYTLCNIYLLMKDYIHEIVN